MKALAADQIQHAEIYAQAIILQYMQTDENHVELGLGTAAEVTGLLWTLIEDYPDCAEIAAGVVEARMREGLPYESIACTVRAMVARARGNALLDEIKGEKQ